MMIRDRPPASRSPSGADKESGIRTRGSGPPCKVHANETENCADHSRIVDTQDIPESQRSLRLVLSKSSDLQMYSHLTGAASLHFVQRPQRRCTISPVCNKAVA